MSEPVFFGVVRHHGREEPRRFFEIVPPCYSDKARLRELVYCTRLDILLNGDGMINAPLDDLMKVYRRLKERGKLPPEDRGVKPKKEGG